MRNSLEGWSLGSQISYFLMPLCVNEEIFSWWSEMFHITQDDLAIVLYLQRFCHTRSFSSSFLQFDSFEQVNRVLRGSPLILEMLCKYGTLFLVWHYIIFTA